MTFCDQIYGCTTTPCWSPKVLPGLSAAVSIDLRPPFTWLANTWGRLVFLQSHVARSWLVEENHGIWLHLPFVCSVPDRSRRRQQRTSMSASTAAISTREPIFLRNPTPMYVPLARLPREGEAVNNILILIHWLPYRFKRYKGTDVRGRPNNSNTACLKRLKEKKWWLDKRSVLNKPPFWVLYESWQEGCLHDFCSANGMSLFFEKKTRYCTFLLCCPWIFRTHWLLKQTAVHFQRIPTGWG